MKTFFISGHIDLTSREYSMFYFSLIENAINEGCNFVVGDADGVDALAQIQLFKMIPESEHSRVKVYFKGNQPKNFFSKGFLSVGGFHSDEEASIAMTLSSEEDIAYINTGRENSMTAKNILRRFTRNFPYQEWANKPSSNKEFWDFVFKGESQS